MRRGQWHDAMPTPDALFAPGSVWLGVHDALSARIAREAGVAAVWLSSYGVSASLKAAPDDSVVTAAEMRAVAGAVCRAAGPVPVVVDCDTGYGNTAVFTPIVRAYARTTPVAALCIEDKRFPKQNTLDASGAEQLVPVAEFVSKLTAGVAMRLAHRPSLGLIARTEALALGVGIEGTLARMRAYAAAGADALLVQAKGPADDLLAVGRRWKFESHLPLICVPTSYPELAAATWWGVGFDVVVRSHQLLQAAVAAQEELLGEIAAARTPPSAYGDRLAPHAEITRAVGDP